MKSRWRRDVEKQDEKYESRAEIEDWVEWSGLYELMKMDEKVEIH